MIAPSRRGDGVRTHRRRLRARHLAVGLPTLAGLYGMLAYLLLPWAWTHYEHQRGLAGRTMLTATAQGIPGDPLNVGFVGSRDDLIRAMGAAQWYPADLLTWRTSIEIAGSVLLDRPYRDAPVSPLFYADRRHHVRIWRVLDSGSEGQPVWLGAATYDRGIGLSRLTGAITHHIAPDVDAERDLIGASLKDVGVVATTYTVSGVGPTLFGRNGEGDRYFTDGDIHVFVLGRDGQDRAGPPAQLPAPALVELKNRAFRILRGER